MSDRTIQVTTLIASACVFLAGQTFAISPSEFDAYETSSMLWTTIPKPATPTVVAQCASGSSCLRNVSGANGPTPYQIVLNEAQWTGDYIEADVYGIEVWLRNTGAQNLYLRIGITNDPDGTGGGGAVGTCYVSQTSVKLKPGVAKLVKFRLSDSAMTLAIEGAHCGGADSLQDVESKVTQLRIFSAHQVSWIPDVVSSVLWIDNIRALGWKALCGSEEGGVTPSRP